MEVNVLLSESAAQRSILSAKSYIQAEGILSAETPEMLADVTSSVGLTVDDAGVFQTGRKEGLYYLVGSKAFALGTVETIGSLARKRLDGKFVVWEATDDGLPGKAPVNVLTFNKWSDALRNFLGRATGAAIVATPVQNPDFVSIFSAASGADQSTAIAKFLNIPKSFAQQIDIDNYGNASSLSITIEPEESDDFDDQEDDVYTLEQYSSETTASDFEVTGVAEGELVLVHQGEEASQVLASGADAIAKFRAVAVAGNPDVRVDKSVKFVESANQPKTETAPTKYTYDPALYKTMTDILDLNGFKISKSGELSHAAPSAFKNSYIETILNDVMLGSRNETTPTGENLLHVYAGYDTAGFIDVANKRIYKEYPNAPAKPKNTGPISLDDLVGTRTSNAPSYPTAATQASAMKKVKINADIAVTETDFDWLQDEIVKENTSGGKYEDKTPLVKSREIATFIYGKTAPVKQVLKTHVFDIKHIESGTCLTVTPIATVKAKKTGYSLVLVSRADSPKMFLNALAGAKFAIVSSQLTPAGSIKGKPELVTKVRNMREGMQYLLVGVQPEV